MYIEHAKVGYYMEDGIFPPTPGMVRGVEETVQLLKKAGHQVIMKWNETHIELAHSINEIIYYKCKMQLLNMLNPHGKKKHNTAQRPHSVVGRRET